MTASSSSLVVVEEIDVAPERRIELCTGDLSKLEPSDNIDILMVSAFRGDYAAIPGTLIGALKRNKGIDVAELAKNKEEDQRKSHNCWLSSVDIEKGFRRLLCYEGSAYRGNVPEMVGDVFRCLIPFISSTSGDTVATPLLQTGNQGYCREAMVDHLVSTAAMWMLNGLRLRKLKIVIFQSAVIKDGYVLKRFLELKKRFHLVKGDILQTETLSKAIIKSKILKEEECKGRSTLMTSPLPAAPSVAPSRPPRLPASVPSKALQMPGAPIIKADIVGAAAPSTNYNDRSEGHDDDGDGIFKAIKSAIKSKISGGSKKKKKSTPMITENPMVAPPPPPLPPPEDLKALSEDEEELDELIDSLGTIEDIVRQEPEKMLIVVCFSESCSSGSVLAKDISNTLTESNPDEIMVLESMAHMSAGQSFQSDMLDLVSCATRIIVLLSNAFLNDRGCVELLHLSLCRSQLRGRCEELLVPWLVEKSMVQLPHYIRLIQYQEVWGSGKVIEACMNLYAALVLELSLGLTFEHQKANNDASENVPTVMSNTSDNIDDDIPTTATVDPDSMFISYAHKDGSVIAERIAELMRNEFPSLQLFIDTSGLRVGSSWQDELFHRASSTKSFVAVLTPAYAESAVCQEEWAIASYRAGYDESCILAGFIIPSGTKDIETSFDEILYSRYSPWAEYTNDYETTDNRIRLIAQKVMSGKQKNNSSESIFSAQSSGIEYELKMWRKGIHDYLNDIATEEGRPVNETMSVFISASSADVHLADIFESTFTKSLPSAKVIIGLDDVSPKDSLVQSSALETCCTIVLLVTSSYIKSRHCMSHLHVALYRQREYLKALSTVTDNPSTNDLLVGTAMESSFVFVLQVLLLDNEKFLYSRSSVPVYLRLLRAVADSSDPWWDRAKRLFESVEETCVMWVANIAARLLLYRETLSPVKRPDESTNANTTILSRFWFDHGVLIMPASIQQERTEFDSANESGVLLREQTAESSICTIS